MDGKTNLGDWLLLYDLGAGTDVIQQNSTHRVSALRNAHVDAAVVGVVLDTESQIVDLKCRLTRS